MGALVFYNPEHRILISGDALWENGYGFVMPRCMDAGGVARDARDARHDRRARRARRDSGSRRSVHRRGAGARARVPAHRGIRSRRLADGAPCAQGRCSPSASSRGERCPSRTCRRTSTRIGIYRDLNAAVPADGRPARWRRCSCPSSSARRRFASRTDVSSPCRGTAPIRYNAPAAAGIHGAVRC